MFGKMVLKRLRRLECIYRVFTLDSLESVCVNVFWRKTLLGALVFSFQCIIMPCQKHITLSYASGLALTNGA